MFLSTLSLTAFLFLGVFGFQKSGNIRLSCPQRYQSQNLCLHATLESDEPTRFDFASSALLAAYAFDAYNEPSTGKAVTGDDCTVITYTSTDFIKTAFRGVAIVTIGQLTLNNKASSEEGILESILSGGDPDPYVMVSVNESRSEGSLDDRIVDRARTEFRKNSRNPVYNQTFLLYVSNLQTAELSFDVFDKDFTKEDDLIGRGTSVRIKDILRETNGSKSIISLPVPIYAEGPKTELPFPQSLLSNVFPEMKRLRVGRLDVSLEFIPWNSEAEVPYGQGLIKPMSLPKGASAPAQWPQLLESVLRVRDKLQPPDAVPVERLPGLKLSSNMHQLCFVENLDTDTQASVYADLFEKRVIVTFRGTEQVKFRDLLTDVNLVQSPIVFAGNETSKLMVHSGFLAAYKSIQPTMLQLLKMIFSSSNFSSSSPPWRIYITGHSLGGALATLFSFDLGRLKLALSYDTSSALPSRVNMFVEDEFSRSIRAMKLRTYLFGAPRVGDKSFVGVYDSLVPHSFRISNQQDVVPRMPRSSKANLIQYEHIGRTVMLDGKGDLWIEGESAGACPLDDIAPIGDFNLSFPSFEQISEASSPKALLSQAMSLAYVAKAPFADATSVEDYPEYLKQSLRKFADNFTSTAFQSDFLDREMDLLSSLLSGVAVQHHLEPSYFSSYQAILSKVCLERGDTILEDNQKT